MPPPVQSVAPSRPGGEDAPHSCGLVPAVHVAWMPRGRECLVWLSPRTGGDCLSRGLGESSLGRRWVCPGRQQPHRQDRRAQCLFPSPQGAPAMLRVSAAAWPLTGRPLSPQFDRSIQKLLATRIAVYLMTFLIVTVAWAAHTRCQLGRLQLCHLGGVTGSYVHSAPTRCRSGGWRAAPHLLG